MNHVNNDNPSPNASLPNYLPKTDVLTDAELMRYSRQILLDNWDIEAQLRLKNSLVVIVGAGGLGCPASETLARAGVGHIHIIDDDIIETSNLQRQTLYTTEDIGKLKAKTACQALSAINAFIKVSYSTERITTQNSVSLSVMLKNMQQHETKAPTDSSRHAAQDILLLDCTDNFAIRRLLNQISVDTKLPLLSAAAIGMSGQLALYEPAKHSGCYNCLFGNETTTDNTATNTTATCVTSGVLASTVLVMGNLQANAALQYLGRGHNPLAGELLIWDGLTMSQHKMRYQQDKTCAVCAY